MPTIEHFLDANRAYAARFDRGGLPMPPATRTAILTCMDARLDPAAFLGLGIGDAHVIRNAGGRASDDAIRSLVISQQLLGTNAILVIHHTDCGMLTFKNEDLRTKVRQELGADADAIDFLPFSDLAESVRADVATLRASPLLLRDTTIWGGIYDVATGRVEPVSVAG